MQLIFDAMLVAQEHKPAGENYPASNDLTFVEIGTGQTVKISSPVAVEKSQELSPIRWVLTDYRVQNINWNKGGRSGTFLKQTCTALSGTLIKAS